MSKQTSHGASRDIATSYFTRLTPAYIHSARAAWLGTRAVVPLARLAIASNMRV
jgi:hypothetical protein